MQGWSVCRHRRSGTGSIIIIAFIVRGPLTLRVSDPVERWPGTPMTVTVERRVLTIRVPVIQYTGKLALPQY